MNNAPEQAEAQKRSYVALKLNPRNEVIRYNYASLLLRMGRYDDAVAMDQAIVEANPKSRPRLASAGGGVSEDESAGGCSGGR